MNYSSHLLKVFVALEILLVGAEVTIISETGDEIQGSLLVSLLGRDEDYIQVVWVYLVELLAQG